MFLGFRENDYEMSVRIIRFRDEEIDTYWLSEMYLPLDELNPDERSFIINYCDVISKLFIQGIKLTYMYYLGLDLDDDVYKYLSEGLQYIYPDYEMMLILWRSLVDDMFSMCEDDELSDCIFTLYYLPFYIIAYGVAFCLEVRCLDDEPTLDTWRLIKFCKDFKRLAKKLGIDFSKPNDVLSI